MGLFIPICNAVLDGIVAGKTVHNFIVVILFIIINNNNTRCLESTTVLKDCNERK